MKIILCDIARNLVFDVLVMIGIERKRYPKWYLLGKRDGMAGKEW